MGVENAEGVVQLWIWFSINYCDEMWVEGLLRVRAGSFVERLCRVSVVQLSGGRLWGHVVNYTHSYFMNYGGIAVDLGGGIRGEGVSGGVVEMCWCVMVIGGDGGGVGRKW
ncbi:hypothetical protein Tco_0744456 [Tanacetum coccineum]